MILKSLPNFSFVVLGQYNVKPVRFGNVKSTYTGLNLDTSFLRTGRRNMVSNQVSSVANSFCESTKRLAFVRWRKTQILIVQIVCFIEIKTDTRCRQEIHCFNQWSGLAISFKAAAVSNGYGMEW